MNKHPLQSQESTIDVPAADQIGNTGTSYAAGQPSTNLVNPAANETAGAQPFGPAPDASIVSLPQSLREQLQRVQLLLNQSEYAKTHGRDDLARAKAEQAVSVMNNLICHSAESATLTMLADMGCQGFQSAIVEQTDGFVIVERRFLGISFGEKVVPTRKVVRRNSQGRVF